MQNIGLFEAFKEKISIVETNFIVEVGDAKVDLFTHVKIFLDLQRTSRVYFPLRNFLGVLSLIPQLKAIHNVLLNSKTYTSLRVRVSRSNERY